MAAFRMNRENKKIDVIWSSGIFFLLVANWQFVGSSDTCRWTTPAPAWNQTDLNDIRTVDILVFNRSTHVPLKWNYTLSPGQKLRTTTFSIDGGDIGVIYHGDAGDDITIYQTRFNISRSEVATLIISKATEREEAIYQCKLSTTSVWAYNIRVKLTELQLHWDETPSNLSTVEEGANITLQWTYSYTLGLETPTFRQAKFTDLSDGDGGRPIANKLAGLKLYVEPPYSDWDINIQNTKASMTIFAVHRSQSGRYKFEVETLSNNKLGRLSSIVNVSVQFAANLTNVSRDHTVREGSNIQLFCEASGEPTPNITWTRVLEDGSNSEVLHNRSNWDFLNINRTASGTYRCTADNGIRNPVSHKVKVNVTYPAKIVKLASEYEVAAQQGASLHCQAEGNPQPTYTWTPCEPQNSVCDESTLHISEVLNDGVYTCKVTNYLGSNSKSTSLVIAGTSINVTLVITSESCTDGKYSLSLLWKKLPETIDEIFGSESSYNSTTLLNVRCGSVIVDLALQFRSVVQESKVLLKLKDAAKNGRLGEYRVSASSIVGTRPQTVTTAPTNTNDNVTPVPDKSDDDKPLKDWMIAVIAAIAGVVLITIVVLLLYCFKIRKKTFGDDVDMSPTSSYVVGGPEVSRSLDRRSYGFESVEDDPFILAASTQSLNSTDGGANIKDASVNYGFSSSDSVQRQPEMLLNPGSRISSNRPMAQSTGETDANASYLVRGPQRDLNTLPPYLEPPSFDEAMLQSERKMKTRKSTGDLTEPRQGRYAGRRPMHAQANPMMSSLGPKTNKDPRKTPLDPTVPYATPHKKKTSNKPRPEPRGAALGHLPHNITNIQDERSQESVLQHPGDLNLDDPSNLPPHEKPPDLPPQIATLPSNQAMSNIYQADPEYDLPEPPVDEDSRSGQDGAKPNQPSSSGQRPQFKPYINVHGQLVMQKVSQTTPTPDPEIPLNQLEPGGNESEDDIDYVTYVV
ncbi:uncharacterized protein LOC144662792 isoform X2 [Oculina patagonica]